MVIVDELRALNGPQRAAFVASLLGWALDAFDYFLLVFVLSAIAKDFHADIAVVNSAIFLTLVARPFGALVFGRLADRHGRRPMLMLVVALYSVLALASAFSPTLTFLLVLRTLFGFAMGGVWGIGASLALETVPAKSRGLISGILQEGYPMGYLLAAIANLFLPVIGWRFLLALGVLPALLILYIQRAVQESPTWAQARTTPAAAAQSLPGAEGALGRAGLRGRADDLLQLLQPRHPGPLSAVPAEAAPLPGRGRHRADHLPQRRRDPRRGDLRAAVGAHRPASRDRAGRPARRCRSFRCGRSPRRRCCSRPARS